MKVWIPKKIEIQLILEDVLDKLRAAEKVTDIEEWIDDALVSLECHISNRASVERGDIKNLTISWGYEPTATLMKGYVPQ